jgi:hypothetical protein
MLVDRSAWGRLRVEGPDHLRFLQGLLTVNVVALPPGSHRWGAILNPKGRVLSVVAAHRADDHVVVLCEPALAEPTRALLERYAVMDDVTFTWLDGPAHAAWPEPGGDAARAWEAPLVEGAPPAAPASAEAEEIVRVEAGMLRFGVDVDADHFPFETPLAQWLDYEKGCYIGQEPVFRVHAQGAAAKVLRALAVRGEGAPAAGTAVAHPERAAAGVVTSAVVSPRWGALALAYLHRTVWAPGGEVEVDGRPARVLELPLRGDAAGQDLPAGG